MKYSNAVLNEMSANEGDGAQTPIHSETALKALRKVLEPKDLAQALDVSERTVQKWKSGESHIPHSRTNDVLRHAKAIFLTDLNRLEDEIDRALLMQYGSADNGRF